MIEMLIGGALVLAGFLIGRFLPARRRAPEQTGPVCGCGHELCHHDPDTGACHAAARIARHVCGRFDHYDYEPCSCRQYTGPQPIGGYYAPEITP